MSETPTANTDTTGVAPRSVRNLLRFFSKFILYAIAGDAVFIHLLPGNWQLGDPVYLTYSHAALFMMFGLIGATAYHHGHANNRQR